MKAIVKLLATSALVSSIALAPSAMANLDINQADNKMMCKKAKQNKMARHGMHHKGFSGKGHNMKRIFKQLDLTDAQREQIKGIFASVKDSNEALREQMKAYRTELKTLVNSDNYSEDAVRALRAQYQTSFDDAEVAKASIKNQVNAVLTDEQRAKKAEIMGKIKARMEKFKERRAEKRQQS
ncbi:hypothetical protein C2869_01390 [Saccharobesus litoralis]|uniref:Periplasmic heavy metal sensor n=1 Tax=Saccharobesus litoralis TaxID=2172099 RepID=A0A2S0VLV8_9ALTE|nr:Spy/CpxP family protein refolding chaperone [Saccharobesus litoralis]AWB65179.1 hypothetical protein C2869_01390 [Saccharobesus litoralis]